MESKWISRILFVELFIGLNFTGKIIYRDIFKSNMSQEFDDTWSYSFYVCCFYTVLYAIIAEKTLDEYTFLDIPCFRVYVLRHHRPNQS